MQHGEVVVLPQPRRAVRPFQAVDAERPMLVFEVRVRQQRCPFLQRRSGDGRTLASVTFPEAGDETGDGLLPRCRPRGRGHHLVVRLGAALARELQVPLILAVQVGFDDRASDLGRHHTALWGARRDLLATTVAWTGDGIIKPCVGHRTAGVDDLGLGPVPVPGGWGRGKRHALQLDDALPRFEAFPGAGGHTTSVSPSCDCLPMSERRFNLRRLPAPSMPLDRQKNPG